MIADTWIAPERLFDGDVIHEDAAVRVLDGLVAEVASPAPKGARKIVGLLTPGFVDLQVNGGGGVMLNGSPTRSTMETMANAHRKFGTVALLPTLITDTPDKMEALVTEAIASKPMQGVVGVHLEGPHISEEKRGTHNADAIRKLDDRTLSCVRRLREADLTVMITVAPEAATDEQISHLSDMGAIVSLGHSNCSANDARRAFSAGASCVTHLFNAMSQMTHRAPGLVGATINSDVFAGIICDGHHVADEMVGLAIRGRAKPDRQFLVTDAMATVGGPDHFDLYGQTIRLEDGKLINAEGSLAGAHTTLFEGVRRLVRIVGVNPATALRMVTSVPASCIRKPELGQLTNRPVSDIVILRDDLSLGGTLERALAKNEIADVSG